jgi:hypothetical protein
MYDRFEKGGNGAKEEEVSALRQLNSGRRAVPRLAEQSEIGIVDAAIGDAAVGFGGPTLTSSRFKGGFFAREGCLGRATCPVQWWGLLSTPATANT